MADVRVAAGAGPRQTPDTVAPQPINRDEEHATFARRKVSIGTCGHALGTACIHESAVRCSLLWTDPSQRSGLVEIRDNLHARIAEAHREGWLGEIEGLQISLAGAADKLAQINRRTTTTIDLGIPTITTHS